MLSHVLPNAQCFYNRFIGGTVTVGQPRRGNNSFAMMYTLIFYCVWHSELKITGMLPEAGNLKPGPHKKKTHARSSGENKQKADQKNVKNRLKHL